MATEKPCPVEGCTLPVEHNFNETAHIMEEVR